MTVVIVVGAFGLLRFGVPATGSGDLASVAACDDDDPVVSVTVTRVYLPASLDELAHSEARRSVSRSFNDFRQCLERKAKMGLWLAFTTRSVQSSGRFVDCTHVRHPHEEPFHYREIVALLNEVAGDTTSSSGDFRNALITIIPDVDDAPDPRDFLGPRLNE
jgi:hypothetical protein